MKTTEMKEVYFCSIEKHDGKFQDMMNVSA